MGVLLAHGASLLLAFCVGLVAGVGLKWWRRRARNSRISRTCSGEIES